MAATFTPQESDDAVVLASVAGRRPHIPQGMSTHAFDLERRGLLARHEEPGRPVTRRWSVTPAGREFLERKGLWPDPPVAESEPEDSREDLVKALLAWAAGKIASTNGAMRHEGYSVERALLAVGAIKERPKRP